MTLPTGNKYAAGDYDFGYGIDWLELVILFLKVIILPWYMIKGLYKLFLWAAARMNELLDYLVDGMYYYQEGRYKRGWWACRAADSCMLMPLLLTIMFMNFYPPVLKSVLTLYFWWYALLWMSLKMLAFLVWDSQASVRRSEYWSANQGQTQSSPEEAKSLLCVFGSIILVGSSVYAYYTVQRLGRVTWTDPTRPSWSYAYTPPKNVYGKNYNKPVVTPAKEKAPVSQAFDTYSAKAAAQRTAANNAFVPPVGTKVYWRYNSAKRWSTGYVHSFSEEKIWIAGTRNSHWPEVYYRNSIILKEYKRKSKLPKTGKLLVADDLFIGMKVRWRYNGPQHSSSWKIGYVESFDQTRVWLTKERDGVWPVPRKIAFLDIKAYED